MSTDLSLFLDATVTLGDRVFTKVRKYTLTTALHSVPEWVVEVFHDDPTLDPATLVGAPVRVDLAELGLPVLQGVVRRVAQQVLDVGTASILILTAAPRWWLTHKRKNHRIFQNRTALEMVRDVLADHRAEMDLPIERLVQGALPSVEYRVQWGETDHDFIFRTLAEMGLLAYQTVESDGSTRWVITDDTTVGSMDCELPYKPQSGILATTKPHVLSVSLQSEICTADMVLRDYDYQKPLYPLEARQVSLEGPAAEQTLSVFDFAVGNFSEDAGGVTLSQRRLEQTRTQSQTYRWEVSTALRPGMRVKLVDHPHEQANGEFLVVSARSEVDLTQSRHVVEVIAAHSSWRPTLLTKPRVAGTETAMVVGEGKEIDVDKEGRIAVHFHWDRRAKGASRRVRVAIPWAGVGRTFWTLPRVGDEVVIAYAHGDPDQPLVVGSVHNAVAPVPFPLPEFDTQSVWLSRSVGNPEGYNMVAMGDLAGAEILAMRAQRDFQMDVINDSNTAIGGKASLVVAKSQAVAVGTDAHITVSGKAELKAKEIRIESLGTRDDVSASQHTVTTKIFSVGAAEATIAADKITLQAGSSTIVLEDGKITITAGLVDINP
ncbi:MAG: type VI secretion system tip protein VgrG [Polyangiaceae bacterium]|nr:type VI secretion system tip protein VgrG [Polyangiaceae bacterium]